MYCAIVSAALVAAVLSIYPRPETLLRVPQDYKSVQAAVDAVPIGGTVLLAQGVHVGPVDMRGKAVTLRSEWGAEFTSILGGPSVIRCASGEGPGTIIEGLTIAGGTGAVGDDGLSRGGGVYIDGTSPRILRCLIVGNSADRGPGAWIRDGQPVFEDCWIHDNISPNTDGIVCEGVAPRFIRCGFHEDGVQWTDAPPVDIRSDCESPGGACCLGNYCVQTTDIACGDAGGFWHQDAACGSGVCPQPCYGDTNADRRVNHTDLIRVLDGWGMCP
ncbi:MAG: hypothetical protein GY894_02835 [Planctomycetes bacterium]|jgi:hypothetical protein|nr:hypothetical protein [Planctomycetota bacterium]MCP4838285.1 hypothetical protein [Planctomycetota bacterium]